MLPLSRRGFLSSSLVAAGTLVVPAMAIPAFAQTRKRPDPLVLELVKEFVVAGHNELETTKRLLAEHAGFLNACWDWGGGDFETALEGAGHMGRKDIAEYLISQGARANIFVLTMLGKTDIVKSLLIAFPELLHSRGPHTLTLVHHARKGEEGSKELLEYLLALNAPEK